MKLKMNYSALIYLPKKKVYTAEVKVDEMMLLLPKIELVFEALRKNADTDFSKEVY